jgi:16S rRNA (uracil1498-N3)-methyltransferase
MITNFYTTPDKVGDEILTIDGEEAKHILSVLRHGAGDEISVVDGRGTKYRVMIEEVSRDFLQGRIIARTRMENEPANHVTLAQAVCRKERMDFLVEKATEIGVSYIIPIVTQRNLVKVDDPSREKAKIERWRRVAIAAMKQSLRSVLPEIHNVTQFGQLLPQIDDFDLCLIASLDKDTKNVGQCDQLRAKPDRTLLIVGPEAGFTDKELSEAKAVDGIPVSLGPRRLRSETAGVVFLFLALHESASLR